jgi:hypothetical protein
VADYSLPSTWDILLNRIESEILTKPSVLDSISQVDESLLYESLVGAKICRFGEISKSIERRLSQFDSRAKTSHNFSTPTQVDYESILTEIGLKYSRNVLPIRAKFSLLSLPIYIPEYKLVLDVTAEPIVHSGSGVTGGSHRLRHLVWSKLGYNVIAVPDTQFENASTVTEKASILGSVINQFVSELKELPEPDMSNRPNQRDASLKEIWSSRDDKRQPRQQLTKSDESTQWESRPANARRRVANNSLDNSQWSSRE